MARIFTIRFTYEGLDYSALITERVRPIATEYSLSMLDSEIAGMLEDQKIYLLPTGALSFYKQEGLPGRLAESILQAITLHVSTPA
ncbi:hypothetical protein [Flaviaesturariibacter terrae]